MQEKNIRKNISENSFKGTTEYDISDDGVHMQNSLGESDVEWSEFRKSGEDDNFFYLVTKSNQFVICEKKRLIGSQLDSLRRLAKLYADK